MTVTSSAAGQPSFGVDIGGSSIKGAIVDQRDGRLVSPRLSLDTPPVPTPARVADVVARASSLEWRGPIGVTVPGIVRTGIVTSADAAGLAEVTYGDTQIARGLVVALIFGTGIGTALVHDGRVLPNSELGDLQLDDYADVEQWASARALAMDQLTYDNWARRVNRFLGYLEMLTPDLFLIGGAVSEDHSEYAHCLSITTPIAPMTLGANAGIVGAAFAALGTHPGAPGHADADTG